jgi:predicted amidohydrolase YtcJ
MSDLAIYKNGKIYTMDEQNPIVHSMAIKEGRIIAFNGEALALQNGAKTIQNLNGKSVFPGFIESHAHPLHYATNLLQLDLRAEVTPSVAHILKAVKERAAVTPKGHWILGMGWDDSKMEEKRFPTIEELSEAAPDHPVFLKRTCVHNAVANWKAFEVSQLPQIPEDPQGGHFDINTKTGLPSGLIQENAMQLFKVPQFTKQQLLDSMRQAQQQFFRWGITTVHDMAVTLEDYEVYKQLQEDDAFDLKLRLWMWATNLMGWKGVQNEVIAKEIPLNEGTDRLNIQGLKYMLDGSVGGKTAAVEKPFEGVEQSTGILYMEQQEINELIKEAIEHDIRISVHGIGERAIEMAVQAITNATTPEQNKQMRNRIEHCALPTEKHLQKIAEYGIIACSSIGFVYSIGDSYLKNLGPERAAYVFPNATFKKYGILAPANTDLPVCDGNPLYAIYSAVTRKTVGGQQLGTAEAISIEDAMKAYTIDAAYSGKDEEIIGSLQIGKYGDFIVLDQNPYEVPSDEIKSIQVMQTVVEGKTVFQLQEAQLV